jgi:phosphoglycolate phosphatase-like HAD superfamily hydrolase
MIQAVIFDLDGTLVDSNELHVASWERAFRHFGKRFSLDALRRQIGKGSDQYLPEFLNAEEMRTLGQKIDEYRPNFSGTNICRVSNHSRKCGSYLKELSATANASRSLARARNRK